MDAAVTVGVALVLAVIAWKVLSGLIKFAAIVCIVAFAAYLYFQGVI